MVNKQLITSIETYLILKGNWQDLYSELENLKNVFGERTDDLYFDTLEDLDIDGRIRLKKNPFNAAQMPIIQDPTRALKLHPVGAMVYNEESGDILIKANKNFWKKMSNALSTI